MGILPGARAGTLNPPQYQKGRVIMADNIVNAAIYRVQADGDNKEEKFAGWKALGYSDKECELLWNLFGSSGKNKIDVVSWYEQQQ